MQSEKLEQKGIKQIDLKAPISESVLFERVDKAIGTFADAEKGKQICKF